MLHAVFCKVTSGDHCFASSSCAARGRGSQSFAMSFSFYPLCAVAVLAFKPTGNAGIVRPCAGFGKLFFGVYRAGMGFVVAISCFLN
jgi:hypothetical protein